MFGPVPPIKEVLNEQQNLLLPLVIVSQYSGNCHRM